MVALQLEQGENDPQHQSTEPNVAASAGHQQQPTPATSPAWPAPVTGHTMI